MELIIICSRFVQTSKQPSICLKAKWRKAAPLIWLYWKSYIFLKTPLFNSQRYSKNHTKNHKNTSYSHYCQAVISRPTNFFTGFGFSERYQKITTSNLYKTRSEQKCENIYLDNVKFISVTILKRAKL